MNRFALRLEWALARVFWEIGMLLPFGSRASLFFIAHGGIRYAFPTFSDFVCWRDELPTQPLPEQLQKGNE